MLKMNDTTETFFLALGMMHGSLKNEDSYMQLISMGYNAEELTQLEKALSVIVQKINKLN